MDFEKVIDYALEKGVSDIHLAPSKPVFLRKNGAMESVGNAITAEDIETIIQQVLNKQQKDTLDEKRQVDFLYASPSAHRLRGNAFYCNAGLSLSFRVIQENIIPFEDLGFPEFVQERILNDKQGLILVVGPTGQGKSTTLASALQARSLKHNEHVLMLEDPIEYLIPSNNSIIQQREIGRDARNFKEALEGAMREDPDVLMVGELRSREDMSDTLTMAETGHLVLGTLHTNNAVQTISRILNSFTSEQRPQIQSQIAANLTMVISQRLVPTIDGGRTLAYEIFTMNYAIANYIRQDKIFQIPNVLQTDSSGEMVMFEQSLAGLVINKRITKEVAEEYAIDKIQLKSLFEFNGIE